MNPNICYLCGRNFGDPQGLLPMFVRKSSVSPEICVDCAYKVISLGYIKKKQNKR